MSTKQARNVLLFVLASSVLILLLSALGVFGGRDAIPALAHPEKLDSAVKEAAQRAEASVKESKEPKSTKAILRKADRSDGSASGRLPRPFHHCTHPMSRPFMT